MNLLLNKLPEYVVVDGTRVPIETDFRYWIGLEIAFKNTDESAKLAAINDIVIGELPSNLNGFIEELSNFYLCADKMVGSNKSANSVRLYDYEVDQYSIYGSFMQHYGIDLTTKKLHWWIFKHMLLELPDNSTFKKIVLYRSVRIDSKMPKEQRNFYAEMKRLYALPDNKTKSQKTRSYAQILAGGMMIK